MNRETMVCASFIGLTLLFGGLISYDQYNAFQIEKSRINSMTLKIKSDLLLKDRQDFRGVTSAPYTLVEFGDYECPPCRSHQKEITNILREYGPKLKLDFRHLPLTTIHPWAMDAALAAEQGRHSGKFWSVHEHLFEARLNTASISQSLKSSGVDIGTADSRSYTDPNKNGGGQKSVNADIAMADSLNIRMTPTFLLCTPEKKIIKLSELNQIKQFIR